MKKLKKILYAEDDIDIQEIVNTVLVDISGYDLKICENGLEALNVVEDYKPDLILLDVMMPEMDGITALRKIKEMKSVKDIPAIFITAKVQTHEVDNLKTMGVLEVISKPFDPLTLSDTIEYLWEKSQLAS